MAIFKKNIGRDVIQKIHDCTMQVMEEKGIRFVSKQARNVFAEHGFRIDGEIVYFAEKQIMDAVNQVPERFVLHGRDPQYDLEIGNGKPVFIPAYGPVFISRNEDVRSAVHTDCVNFMKLSQNSPVIDIMNPYVVTPSDVEKDDLLMYQQALCLKYGSKPTMSITAGYEASKKAIQTIKAVNQKDPSDYVTIGLISALSPLSFDETMIGGLFAFAEEGQPVIIGCGALPGATSPVSILGTMITATAELLAGITLAQLIHPGLPCIYGNVAAGTDLSYVTPAIGTPEAARIAALSKAMCEFYHIPCRGGGSLCDAKQTDFEAGSESALVILASLEAGLDFIIHATGILDSFNIIGYEKFLLDEQNIQAFQFMLREPDLDNDIIGMDTIMEVPHSMQYLEEDHTFDYMREELFVPKISLHGYFDSWKSKGSQTLVEKASVAVDRRLESYVAPELTVEQDAVLAPYLNINFLEA